MEAEKGMSRGDALNGLGAAALVAPWVLLGSAGVRAADDTQTFKDNKYPVRSLTRTQLMQGMRTEETDGERS